jgi:hypothetical protein
MNHIPYIYDHIVPELPDFLKINEYSEGCFLVKNAKNGRVLTYFSKTNRIFLNFNGRWNNEIYPAYVKDYIIESLTKV